MSERWKYQIKSGLVFGITLAVALSFFKALDIGFVNEYFSLQFLLKLVVLLIVGIFLIGYYNWKEKEKYKKE